MSPVSDVLQEMLQDLALQQKDAHSNLLMEGERRAAAHAWDTYQQAKAMQQQLAAIVREPDEDLNDAV